MPFSRSTLLFNVVVIISYSVEYPWLSNCTFGFPLFVLMNTLAGHIYRNIRFKVYMDQTINSSVINKNLTRAPTTTTTTTLPTSTLSPNPTSDDRHVLDNIFKRSGTVVTTTWTGPTRHSLHSIEEDGIQGHGGDGRRDLEKQDDIVYEEFQRRG